MSKTSMLRSHNRATAEQREHVARIPVFIPHLIHRAEDVGIVLLETSHTCEAGERSASFVTVKNTKVGHTQWELSVASLAGSKDQAVTRTVHWLSDGSDGGKTQSPLCTCTVTVLSLGSTVYLPLERKHPFPPQA